MFQTEQNNQAPFIQAGQTSIGQLMGDIQSGKFGPGSLPDVPQFNESFKAPTAEEARATPGYQFTAQQGSKGILQGAAAAGGAISGGTLKALDTFNTGLADSTYNDVFSRAMSGYNADLSKYGAQLQGFQVGQSAQQQGFNQLLAPAQLGEGATQNMNSTGQNVATNVGNLMTERGNVLAAGQAATGQNWSNALGSLGGDFSQALLFSKLLGGSTAGKQVPVVSGVIPDPAASQAQLDAAVNNAIMQGQVP